MNIIVFGATEQTGRIVVKRLLEHKHNVTAFVRTPDKLRIADGHLTIVDASVLNAEEVSKAMRNQEAVISCLGGMGNKKSTILTDMTKSIVDAMKKK